MPLAHAFSREVRGGKCDGRYVAGRGNSVTPHARHCEAEGRGNPVITSKGKPLDCFALLAMTAKGMTAKGSRLKA